MGPLHDSPASVAEFIAHARTDVPLLLAVAEAARALMAVDDEPPDPGAARGWVTRYRSVSDALRDALAALDA